MCIVCLVVAGSAWLIAVGIAGFLLQALPRGLRQWVVLLKEALELREQWRRRTEQVSTPPPARRCG